MRTKNAKMKKKKDVIMESPVLYKPMVKLVSTDSKRNHYVSENRTKKIDSFMISSNSIFRHFSIFGSIRPINNAMKEIAVNRRRVGRHSQ